MLLIFLSIKYMDSGFDVDTEILTPYGFISMDKNHLSSMLVVTDEDHLQFVDVEFYEQQTTEHTDMILIRTQCGEIMMTPKSQVVVTYDGQEGEATAEELVGQSGVSLVTAYGTQSNKHLDKLIDKYNPEMDDYRYHFTLKSRAQADRVLISAIRHGLACTYGGTGGRMVCIRDIGRRCLKCRSIEKIGYSGAIWDIPSETPILMRRHGVVFLAR